MENTNIEHSSKNNVNLLKNEHVLVCISSSPSNERVIKTASSIAKATGGSLTALYVEDKKLLSHADQKRLNKNIALAGTLGAKPVHIYGSDICLLIAEYAKSSSVTKIVIGQSNSRSFIKDKSFTQKLSKIVPDIDIYIIPDGKTKTKPTSHSIFPFKIHKIQSIDILKSVSILLLCSLINFIFYYLNFNQTNIIIIYLIGVLVTAIWTNGFIISTISSILSVLLFNFLFTKPVFSFITYDSSYFITFFIMMLCGVLTGSLTAKIKYQSSMYARKAYRTEVLLETSQKLQKAQSKNHILHCTAEQIYKLIDCPILFYKTENNIVSFDFSYPETEDIHDFLTDNEHTVADWVFRNNRLAGITTNTFKSSKCLYLAVRGQNNALAVVAVAINEQNELDIFTKNLLIAILDECGLALDKQNLILQNQQIEMKAQQEALRANLLRAISHDLRTPLTSIAGNAGILMENENAFDKDKRKSLYADIYDDSMWLVTLVENLLSITRLENGAINLKFEPEIIEDVFEEAINHLDRRKSEYNIQTDVEDEFLMAKMDVRLIIQVIINIVNNAIKYTPTGSTITLSAKAQNGMVLIQISDNGNGISDEDKKHLFDMYYTANSARSDSRRGLGLGLNLCKSIVNAHGGQISVSDNVPSGCVFSFTLQSVEVNIYE